MFGWGQRRKRREERDNAARMRGERPEGEREAARRSAGEPGAWGGMEPRGSATSGTLRFAGTAATGKAGPIGGTGGIGGAGASVGTGGAGSTGATGPLGATGSAHVLPTGEGPGANADPWAPLLAVCEALRQGDFTEAAERLTDVPERVQYALRDVIDFWNREYLDLQKAVSAAVEHGSRPMLASDRLAGETRRQTEQIDHLAAVAEELAASVSEVSGRVDQVSQATRAALEQVRIGSERVVGALEGMVETGDAVNDLRTHIAGLDEAVRPIEDVMKLIDEIADQTNLLALNAAIEAARAGAHGRGFAVVADEVRRLAVKTNESVKEVQQRITVVRQGTAKVSEVMERVASRMAEGVRWAKEGQEALNGIGVAIENAVQPIAEIAASTEEQSDAIGQSAESTQEIAKAAESIEGAAGELAVMVSDLQDILRGARERGTGLKLILDDGDLLELTRADHVLWVQRLRAMMLGRESLEKSDMTDHTRCRLGRWYYGAASGRYGHNETFRALEEPHRRIHATASRAVEAWNAGRAQEAQRLLQEVVTLSNEILEILSRLHSQIVRDPLRKRASQHGVRG